jgi:DNA polymerase III delta prime subunit
MSIKNLLLWEKYRPKNIEDTILLDRIRNHFESGVNKNYIFHGHYGTGKTTLARILIGKYSKDKAYLEINSSLYTSIDILRNEIEKFCKTVPMIESDDPMKYIFLDEFERVSSNYQDALKAFIEQYHKNVRFILTTNHLNKISDGIKSRFTCIDFNCNDIKEEKYLKQEIYKKIVNVIAPAESIEITKEQLAYLINKKFPDFRGILVELQNFRDTGELNSVESNISNKLKIDLYKILYEDMSYEEIYHFLMSNFGADKIDILISLLSKNFVEWSLKEKRENIDKLFELNYVIADYSSKLDTNTDPIILAMTIIGKFKDILRQ